VVQPDGDASAPTPEQLDKLEWWTAALYQWSARTWRACGGER
jgi:hypothetical protein